MHLNTYLIYNILVPQNGGHWARDLGHWARGPTPGKALQALFGNAATQQKRIIS